MQISDLVAETTSATSCATITLLGAVAGFRTFASGFTVGATGIPVCVKSTTGAFEIGLFTLTSASLLTRTSIISSSNGGAAVTFSAGTKDVNCTVPAAILNGMASASAPTVTTVATPDTFKLAGFDASGVPQQISVTNLVASIGVADASLPAAGTLLDSDIMTVTRADGTVYQTTYGTVKGGVAPAADTTAPVLTSATSASTGSTTGSGSVTTNEANGTLYWIASTSASGVTVAAIKAGSSVVVTSTGSKAVTVSGLTAATAYYIHFLHRDAAGNDSTVAISPSFTTASAADTTAPTLTLPTGTQTGQTTATGTVTTNEANGTLYYMVSTNAVESAATVKAGASQAVTATGVQNVSYSGLTAATQYYTHYLHRDAAGNDSTVVNGTGFTTASAAAPTYALTRSSPAGSALVPAPGKTTLTAVAVGAGVYNSFAATATNLLDAAYSFGVSPVPPDGIWLGCGTSNATPPPLAPAGTSATSSTMKVPGGKLLKATTGSAFTNGQYYNHPGFLFQEGIPGVYNWYYWIVTSDGVQVCLNPNNPIVITLTAS